MPEMPGATPEVPAPSALDGKGREKITTGRRHILTVSVEEFFHGGALSSVVLRKHWDRFESRLEKNVDDALKTLERFDQKATFFVLGWIAERSPDIVRRIAQHGHEVASRGFWPRGVAGMVHEEFEEDLDRTREVLELPGVNRVIGFRSPRWLKKDELWILEVLARKGYQYDSMNLWATGGTWTITAMHIPTKEILDLLRANLRTR